MSITIENTTFDRTAYDAEADVLYLHVGHPDHAVDFDETPEGHALRFGPAGELVGVTIVGARHLLETESSMTITLSTPVPIDRSALADAIAGR